MRIQIIYDIECMTKKKDHFPEHLKHIRDSKDLSQGDLAKRAGLQPAAISHFETGERKPSFDNLIKLADALGVSMDYLFGRNGDQVSTAYGKLLDDFQRLPPKDQEVVQDLVQVMLKKNPKQS